MKTTQAWGWLAAGVMALGLNGIYHDGGAEWAHRVVGRMIDKIDERTEPAIALATGRAGWFAARAKMVAVREETASCRSAGRVQTRVARMQNGLVHFEVMSARQDAMMARMGAQRALVHVAPVVQVELPAEACTRVRVAIPRVKVPQAPTVRIPARVVRVEWRGAGPA